MAERKWYQKLIDIGAAFIDKNDEFWPKVYKACGKAAAKLIDAGAAAIEKYDILVLYIQRLNLITRYSLAKFIHEQRETLGRYRNQILSHGAGALLVAIALVAVYNHFMCYEYSYNGRVMGYVSEQESVLAVLDVASEELSAEYGSDIRIDSDSNISFKRVSGVQKNIDSEDDVLKRFTYMSDVKAAGYAISAESDYVDECKELLDYLYDGQSEMWDAFVASGRYIVTYGEGSDNIPNYELFKPFIDLMNEGKAFHWCNQAWPAGTETTMENMFSEMIGGQGTTVDDITQGMQDKFEDLLDE